MQDSTNQVVSSTTGNMGDLFVFPDFNVDDVTTWFEEFNLWIEIQKITDYERIFCALMKKLPKEFFKLVAPKIDHTAAGNVKFDQAKRLITEEANKLNKDSIDLFNACVKRSDVNFVQFLATENLSDSQIKKKFLASLIALTAVSSIFSNELLSFSLI